MADTKWTKEQERAISDRGKGIIVSAAAGSGKTTVLIERMIQLLSDEKNKIPADRLLAVTFTKEAASSMKENSAVLLTNSFAVTLKTSGCLVSKILSSLRGYLQ